MRREVAVEQAVCAPAFAPVAAAAARAFAAARGGALCAYVGGEPVLDVWGGVRDPATGAPWRRDTTAMVWSTTKGITSTVLHLLVDRGRLRLDDPIARWWPAFGTAGKAATTVAHLLGMEAGLYDVRRLVDDPADLLDHDRMADALAAAAPAHPPGAATGYHALTYGWLAGELVRRVTGDTLGAFVRSQIAAPLALDGCHVGVPGAELGRVAARPRLRPEPAAVRATAKLADPVLRAAGCSPRRLAAAFAPRGGHEVIGTEAFLQVESPGINGVATARSLARLYAALTADDGLDGVRLWSPATRTVATTRRGHGRDLVVPLRVGWMLGYHPPFPRRHASPGAFGFFGSYGSGAYAEPAAGLAVGLVTQEAAGLPLPALVAPLRAAARRHRAGPGASGAG